MEPIRCRKQTLNLIPVWIEDATPTVVSCVWTLDLQLFVLLGKVLEPWEGSASLGVLGHCRKALRASSSALLPVNPMLPGSR